MNAISIHGEGDDAVSQTPDAVTAAAEGAGVESVSTPVSSSEQPKGPPSASDMTAIFAARQTASISAPRRAHTEATQSSGLMAWVKRFLPGNNQN